MSGIAVAGNAILDQYKLIDTYPAASSLVSVRSVARTPGGLMCNCAIDLARLDPSLRIPVVGVVGDDPDGDYLAGQLASYPGIDTSQLHRAGTTSFTDVMEDSTTKTRTFFQYRGANAELDVEHVDFDRLDANLLHAGYILLLDRLDDTDDVYGTRMARLLATARRHGLRTSVDVVSEQSDRFSRLVPPALRYTDYCVLNETEAARTTGITIQDAGTINRSALRRAAEALLGMGVSTWVVIHWPGGAVGLSRQGAWEERPSVRLRPDQIVTTTGAGDAFAAGVLYAAWSGAGLSDALELGTGAAACSLLAGSATDGVRSHHDVLAFYRDNPHHTL
ncbi:MAG: carbohydrate kinase family protein [Propionicimonas sp.]|uniref:carbohydrate kinase family protein n=1 Tax=Propionicimonas sp. TaxID=1955623 RepID=UPI002B1F492B|nr:carbohydrate kinase family protein [Propionicimonas sp.]MEA4945296.1 carbohydrate kinase family protein [Propionicimonas sp.]MEA5118258.1 carbohydrate kinase family protein [Propionicimonas sp.]